MIHRVRLFARAKELAGTDALSLELAASANVANVRQKLAAVYPQLEPILARSAIAVNDEFADDATILARDAEIAVLPPVSGGAA